jgi:chemotaxis protein histidine kinase CheA
MATDSTATAASKTTIKDLMDHVLECYDHAKDKIDQIKTENMTLESRDKHAEMNARPAKPVKSSRAQKKQPLHGNSVKPAQKQAKPAKKPKKSGSKSTRAHTMSMNVDAEDLDDLDY